MAPGREVVCSERERAGWRLSKKTLGSPRKLRGEVILIKEVMNRKVDAEEQVLRSDTAGEPLCPGVRCQPLRREIRNILSANK